MSVCVYVCLSVCLSVCHVCHVCQSIQQEVTGTDDSSHFTSTPHVVKQVLVALSALSNPVIYLWLMPDYRQACRRLLLPPTGCCRPPTRLARVTPHSPRPADPTGAGPLDSNSTQLVVWTCGTAAQVTNGEARYSRRHAPKPFRPRHPLV